MNDMVKMAVTECKVVVKIEEEDVYESYWEGVRACMLSVDELS